MRRARRLKRKARDFWITAWTVPEWGPQREVYEKQKVAAEERMDEFDDMPADARALIAAIGLGKQWEINLIYELAREGVTGHARIERIKADRGYRRQQESAEANY